MRTVHTAFVLSTLETWTATEQYYYSSAGWVRAISQQLKLLHGPLDLDLYLAWVSVLVQQMDTGEVGLYNLR